VETKDYIQQDFENQKKEYVLDFIRKKELLSSEENIIFSQKVFVINSVLKWCMDAASKNEMSREKWNKFHRLLSQYIAGIVDIKWKDGSLEVIEIPNNDKKRRNTRQRTKTK